MVSVGHLQQQTTFAMQEGYHNLLHNEDKSPFCLNFRLTYVKL